MLERLALVGTGLIGASVGLAAKRTGVSHVVGWDSDAKSLGLAAERGAVDEAAGSLEAAVAEAELALVATPVATLKGEVAATLAAGLRATVTDVGSTKSGLRESVSDRARFIGGHPVCGSEARGPGHASAELLGIVEEDVDPDPRVRARDTGHVAEGTACAGERLVPVHLHRAGVVQDDVRKRVWEMAREREKAVVCARVDRDRNRPERGDEAVQEPVALRLRLLNRRQKPCRALEELLAPARRAAGLRAADGMAADEANAVGNGRADGRLRRADIRDRGAGIRGGENLFHPLLEVRDRRGDDDQLCLLDRRDETFDGLVQGAALGRDREKLGVGVVSGDMAHAGPLGGEPDRGADQAGADDGEPLDRH